MGGGASAGGSVVGTGGGSAGGSVAGGAVAGGSAGGAGGGSVGLVGDTCANPITIAGSGIVMGTTVTARGDYAPSSSPCKPGDGPELVYRLNVPAGHRLDVTATPLTRFDLVLNLVTDAAACAGATGMQCLRGADAAGAQLAERVSYTNTGAAQQVLLVVDGYDTGDVGPFSLDVTIQPLLVGDTCTGPMPLTPGTPMTNQALAGYASDYGPFVSGRCLFSGGIDRVYSVMVPAGHRLAATVTPNGFDSRLNLIRGATNCTMAVCDANGDQGDANGPDSLTWDNQGSASETVLLVVDSSAMSAGTFTLDATVTAAPAFVVGGTSCGAPAVLDAGTYSSTTSGGTSGFDFPSQGGCAETSDAPDRVYSLSVPPNSLLRTTVTGAGWDVVLNVTSSAGACGFTLDAGTTIGATCIAASDGPLVESVERVTLRNPGATPMTALLIVDGLDGDRGTFTITNEVLPLAALVGDTCQAPQVLAMSGSLTGLSTVGYVNDVETTASCTNYQNRGNDRVFSISVPPGKLLTASVIPNGWDAAIYLLDPAQCGQGAVCLNGSDMGSGPESARFTNAGTTARDVLIVVDSARPGASGTFDLVTSVTP